VPARPLFDAARPASDAPPIDVVCVGNALMDHLAFADFDVLDALGLPVGGMTLVDIPTTVRIGEVVGGSQQVPGGTVTNTAVGIASLGGNPAFVGAVADDELGDRYAADLEAAGVRAVLERFPHVPRDPDAATGRCFVVITPDAERTMATALGAGGRLDRTGIDAAVLGAAKLVYFDGYLLDLPDADAIVDTIVGATRAAGTAVAIGLADSMLVERHHGRLSRLVEDVVDIVFANEAEICALAATEDVAAALAALARPGLVAVATCGPAGAYVGHAGGVTEVSAAHVGEPVDRTGAGDLFAAGFCFGATHGFDVAGAAALGSLVAAEVVTHLGARPVVSLADLAAGAGLASRA
jgi:sugar/nucleoside kinase (ribokinase family)